MPFEVGCTQRTVEDVCVLGVRPETPGPSLGRGAPSSLSWTERLFGWNGRKPWEVNPNGVLPGEVNLNCVLP